MAAKRAVIRHNMPFLPALLAWLESTDFGGKQPLLLLPTVRSARVLRALSGGKYLCFPVFSLEKLVAFLGGNAPVAEDGGWAVLGEIYNIINNLEEHSTPARVLARAVDTRNLLNKLDVYGVSPADLRALEGPPGGGQAAVLADIYERVQEVMNLRSICGHLAANSGKFEALQHLLSTESCRFLPIVAGVHDTPPALTAFLQSLDGWHVVRAKDDGMTGQQVDGVTVATRRREAVAPSAWGEVRMTALAVRRALAAGHKTVAVVSGERRFNDKLQGELARWGLRAQDSAGVPVAATTAGRLWASVMEVLASPDVVRWAALKRAPLLVENADWKGLWQALPGRATGPAWRVALESLTDAAAPGWRDAEGGPEVVTALAVLEQGDSVTGRQGDGSLVLGGPLVSALVLRALREAVVMRDGNEGLFLLGPLEARLLDFDCLIVPSAVEGVWPAFAHEPWLAPAQLRALGLPDATARAAVAGVDFEGFLHGGHREVVVIRPEKTDGAERTPSRFLKQGDRATGRQDDNKAFLESDEELPALLAALEQDDSVTGRQDAMGVFVPQGTQWPQGWSASFVETLMACPYRAYGERVLKLLEMEPIEPEPDARAGGLLLHAWLERAGREFPHVSDENRAVVENRLRAIAEELLDEEDALVRALWRPRMRKLTPALVARWIEDDRTVNRIEHWVEKDVGAATFKAKIDRIETGPDGQRVVLDYKTGAPPSWSAVADGTRPQLALEAWLLGDVSHLEYWRLRGFGGRVLEVAGRDAAPYVEPVADGVAQLVEAFGAGKNFPALPDLAGGGLLDTGHCEYCKLSDICRKRVAS